MAPSTTTIEAIQREPPRQATGAIAEPKPKNHSTAYSGGCASQKIMAAATPIFHTSSVGQAAPKTDPSSQKHDISLKTSIASSPSTRRESQIQFGKYFPNFFFSLVYALCGWMFSCCGVLTYMPTLTFRLRGTSNGAIDNKQRRGSF